MSRNRIDDVGERSGRREELEEVEPSGARRERERERREKTYQQCGNGRPCCPGDELFLCSACSGFVAIIPRRGRHSSLKEKEEEEVFLSLDGNSMDLRIR